MDQNIARVIRAATSNAESNANPACFYANAKKRFGLDDGKKVKATSSSMENSKFGNDDDLFFDDDAEEKQRGEEGATVDEKKAFTRKRKSRVVGSGSGGANEIASVADDDDCVRFKMRAEKTNEEEEKDDAKTDVLRSRTKVIHARELPDMWFDVCERRTFGRGVA